jgi:hypothetical protein
MAKRVIILDMQGGRVRYALWATVPAGREAFHARAGAVSQWTGASAEENAAIAAGQVVEFVDVLGSNGTNAQIRAALEARWTDYQAEITARNPWNRYGSFWDGTSWTAAGVS